MIQKKKKSVGDNQALSACMNKSSKIFAFLKLNKNSKKVTRFTWQRHLLHNSDMNESICKSEIGYL